MSGFGLRIYPTSRKVYVVQYKLHGRTPRKIVGKHGVVTANEARKDVNQTHNVSGDRKPTEDCPPKN